LVKIQIRIKERKRAETLTLWIRASGLTLFVVPDPWLPCGRHRKQEGGFRLPLPLGIMVGWKPRTLVIATRPLILVVDVGSGKTLGCRCSSVHLTGSGCSEDPPKGTTANRLGGGALTIEWARASERTRGCRRRGHSTSPPLFSLVHLDRDRGNGG
jgi:hypothetical protein